MIDEQLNKDLRKIYNPDGSSLRDVQLRMLEILKIVDGICRRNNIHYWLSSGTLLGAVRHGGFIPWDDDIDIEILYQDRNRFIKACKKELPGNLCIQYHDTEPEYYLNILKVRDIISDIGEKAHLGLYGDYDVPYKAKGYFVDILCEECICPLFLSISNKLYSKLLIERFVHNKSSRRCHWYFIFISILNSFFRVFSKLFASKKYLYHTYGSCFMSRRNVDYIEPLQEVMFEDLRVFTPANPDGYLRDMFGDYMELPSENLRSSHHSELQ